MNQILTEIAKWMAIAWFVTVIVGMLGMLSDRGTWQTTLIYISSFIYAVAGICMLVISAIINL